MVLGSLNVVQFTGDAVSEFLNFPHGTFLTFLGALSRQSCVSVEIINSTQELL